MSAAPLQGLKVVDMGWLMVGPESGRYLADLGAEVIKVESGVRRDPMRSLGPFKDGKHGPNRSIGYHAINAGKTSLTLDVKDPRGRDILLKLVAWADVLIESFTPGVIDSLKISYADLSAVNPRLIMVSTSILGQAGPHSKGASGTGTTGAAFAGATNLLGWPDRAPMGPFGPWTDAVTPRMIVSTVLAALHRRRQTGTGCYIDAAQAECGIQFLMPAYYDYAVNGTIPQRRGAAGSPLRSPSGLFACIGADRWVAIDASADDAFAALRGVIGGVLSEARFDTLIGRLRGRAGLEAAIAAWTAPQEAQGVEDRLQAAGVPAHVVAQPADLVADADLKHLGHYHTIEDPEIGQAVIRGPQARLSRTPHVATRAGPRLGDGNHDILSRICGLSPAEIEALEAAGLLA